MHRGFLRQVIRAKLRVHDSDNIRQTKSYIESAPQIALGVFPIHRDVRRWRLTSTLANASLRSFKLEAPNVLENCTLPRGSEGRRPRTVDPLSRLNSTIVGSVRRVGRPHRGQVAGCRASRGQELAAIYEDPQNMTVMRIIRLLADVGAGVFPGRIGRTVPRSSQATDGGLESVANDAPLQLEREPGSTGMRETKVLAGSGTRRGVPCVPWSPSQSRARRVMSC